MATLDDILTTQKNGVVAINNLSRDISALYDFYQLVSGKSTSVTISSPTTIIVGAGRLVSVNVVDAGTTSGTIYDAVSYATTATTGNTTTATITYNGINAFSNGDTVYVSGVSPSGYNTTGATVTGNTSNTVSYNNATTTAMTTAGIVFNKKDAQRLATIATTIGRFDVGVIFQNGLTIVPGTGQSLNVNYSMN